MADIEDRFLDFLRRRIDEMGVLGSGAYDYYAQRVERGEAFMPYERAVMRDVIALRPSRVVHAGIGIGPVTAALAQAGIPAVGYEKDKSRFAAAVALRETLGLDYDLRQSYYPDDDVGRGGLLLFTNVGAGWTRQQEDAVIDTFGNFDTVILDLRLFGSVRDTGAEQGALRDRLLAVGRVENLPPIGGAAYVRIRPSPEGRRAGRGQPPPSVPTSPRDAPLPVDALEAELVDFHRDRLSTLGRDASGLFEHYEQLVTRGALFSGSDRRQLGYILESLPPYDHYVVYRAGLGELAFALALSGRRVSAWEPNAARRSAIRETMDWLGGRHLFIGENFRLAGALLEAIDFDPTERSLGVAPVLVGVSDKADDVGVLDHLGRNSAILFNPRLFLVQREPAEADAQCQALLKQAGFQSFQPAVGELQLATMSVNSPTFAAL